MIPQTCRECSSSSSVAVDGQYLQESVRGAWGTPNARVVFLLIALLAHSVVAADSDPPRLPEAVAAHEATTEAARAEVDSAFRTAIKNAANADQLDEVQGLLDARTRFLTFGEMPDSPSVAATLDAYKEKRKASARNVVAAYRLEIENAAKALRLEDATRFGTKLNKFINAERIAVGLPADEKLVTTGSEPDPKPSEGRVTQDVLEAFVTQLLSELERISKFQTSAMQDAEHRAVIDRLNKDLQKRMLVFRFPISNVSEDSDGKTFDLKFDAALELRDINYAFRISGMNSVRLTQTEAISLTTNHVYEIRGTGRLAYKQYSDNDRLPRSLHIFTVHSPITPNYYFIYVSDYKTKIRKLTDEERENAELHGSGAPDAEGRASSLSGHAPTTGMPPGLSVGAESSPGTVGTPKKSGRSGESEKPKVRRSE